MEEETASQQENGKLPILDYQVWKEEEEKEDGTRSTKIKWQYYEKKMVRRKVMMADTALPERMKTTVLAQEVIRRERNTARSVENEIRIKIRNKLMMKLRLSGYGMRQRINIFVSGLRGYRKMTDREDQGIRKINRSREEGARGRRIRKILGKTEWFKKGGNKEKKKIGSRKVPGIREMKSKDFRKPKDEKEKARKIEAVLFVPYTKGGELQRRLQEVEDRYLAGSN